MFALSLFALVGAKNWPNWPEHPLPKEGAAALHAEHAPPQMLHARHRLQDTPAEDVGITAPHPNETALVHIIGWSSLGVILALFFAALALCGMQVEGDSLLYSKGKVD